MAEQPWLDDPAYRQRRADARRAILGNETPRDPQQRAALRLAVEAFNAAYDAQESRVRDLEALTGTAYLTDSEHAVMAALATVWDTFVNEIVEHGETREHDLDEIAADIHALQRTVMKQAAARAYPSRYRLLGGVVGQ